MDDYELREFALYGIKVHESSSLQYTSWELSERTRLKVPGVILPEARCPSRELHWMKYPGLKVPSLNCTAWDTTISLI